MRARLPSALLLLICVTSLLAMPKEEEAIEQRLRADLQYLSGPACEGRAVGTKGLDLAAEYIAREFDKAGLRHAGKGKGWFQSFAVALSARRGSEQKLAFRGPLGQTIELEHGTHFLVPLGSTSSQLRDTPIVFAGHGVRSKNPAYDDYAGLDVKGKVVVIIESLPRGGADFPERPILTDRVLQAKSQGVAALIVVAASSPTAEILRPARAFDTQADQPLDLPHLRLRREWLDRLLQSVRGKSLSQVEKEISITNAPSSGPLLGWTCSLKTEVSHTFKQTKNVVGILEGSGPLAEETVVIGAHYDHVGLASVVAPEAVRASVQFTDRRAAPGSIGGVGFPFTQMFGPAIHPGADDNASGTAVVMELARRFAADKKRQGRRLVFIAFSGEEAGLLGSAWYCRNPVVPIEKTALMINMDMVGRLQDDKLRISGVGTTTILPAIVKRLNEKHKFALSLRATPDGDTDHRSFLRAGIPAMNFFTGFHEQYHRPNDRIELINFSGLRRVAAIVGDIAEEVARAEQVPPLSKPEGSYDRTKTLWATAPATGILTKSREGVEVDDVVPGTAAQRAGLRKGDRLLWAAKTAITTETQFAQLARTWKAGQEIELRLVREGKEQTLTLKLARAPSGLEPTPALLLGFEIESDPEAVILRSLRKNGAGTLAGLRVRDRITAVDGKAIESVADFLGAIEGIKPGRAFALRILRGESALEVNLRTRAAPAVGFAVEPREAKEGMLFVVDVERTGAAAKAGIAVGDRLISIDGKEIKTPTAFAEAILAIGERASAVKIVVDVEGEQCLRVLRLGK